MTIKCKITLHNIDNLSYLYIGRFFRYFLMKLWFLSRGGTYLIRNFWRTNHQQGVKLMDLTCVSLMKWYHWILPSESQWG